MKMEFNIHGSPEFFLESVDNGINKALNRKTISSLDAIRTHEYLDELSGHNSIGHNHKKNLVMMRVKTREFLNGVAV